MDRRPTCAVVIAAILLIVGCATERERRAGTPIDVTGVWTGVTVAPNGAYPISLTLHQVGEAVTGTMIVGGSAPWNGPIEGTVSGNDFTYRMRSGAGGDVVVNGDAMTGTGRSGGRLALRRQR